MFSPVDNARQEITQAGWVKHLDWETEVDSTNSLARRWLETEEHNSAVPALFVADRQSAGRGRSQNKWWSPDGCLMFTLVIDASQMRAEQKDWPQLALVAGVALARVAATNAPKAEVQLKWPNDLYLNGKKAAGMLIESGPGHHWLVGIGINVNVDFADAAKELQEKATSLHKFAGIGSSVTPASFLIELCSGLQVDLKAWRSGEDAWLDAWRQICLLTGKQVQVQQRHQLLVGLCQGIDAHGQLLLRTESGLETVNSGEILAWQ